MKKNQKEKLNLKKTSVVELNLLEMKKILGGTDDTQTINSDTTGIRTFTTCSTSLTLTK